MELIHLYISFFFLLINIYLFICHSSFLLSLPSSLHPPPSYTGKVMHDPKVSSREWIFPFY